MSDYKKLCHNWDINCLFSKRHLCSD